MLGVLRKTETNQGLLARFFDFQFPEKLISEFPETWRALQVMLHDANLPNAPIVFLHNLFLANAAGLQLLRQQLKDAPSDQINELTLRALRGIIERSLDACYLDCDAPFDVAAKINDEVSLMSNGYVAFEVTITSNDDGAPRKAPLVFLYSKLSVWQEGKGWEVKCDSSNNSEQSIARNELNVELIVHDPEQANAIRQRQYGWHLESYQSQQASGSDAGPAQSADD